MPILRKPSIPTPQHNRMLPKPLRMMHRLMLLCRLPAYIHYIRLILTIVLLPFQSLCLIRFSRTFTYERGISEQVYGFQDRTPSTSHATINVADKVCPERPGAFGPGRGWAQVDGCAGVRCALC
jgi:hypothetical protein